MPSLPQWADYNESAFIIKDNQIEKFSTGIVATAEQKSAKPNLLVYLTNDNKIGIKNLSDNSVKIFDPLPGKKCINLSVSPDYQRVVFEIFGGNLFSMRTDGTELTDLGKGYRAKWMKDSQHIIYMITEDDGHTFTSSDIYIINYDGSDKQNITNSPDRIEISPSASYVNNKIVFEVFNEGSIYFMNLE
jgi:Tol biopolymer transport system component